MAWKRRRGAYYLALVVGTTAAFTIVYNFGMATWEGRPQPWYRSLEVVVQTFTTTGFGEDAGWRTPQMNLLMIVMQLAGIGLLLTALDVFAVPWLRDAMTPTPPTRVSGLSDHVVVCGYSPRGEAFLAELDSRDRPAVVVEADEETAADLHAGGRRVVHGDPESTAVLRRAGIEDARAVVADAADDANASIVLSARETDPDARVVTLVEDAELAGYLRVAGADEVLSPRQLLGESLAGQVPTAVTAAADEGVEIGEEFELLELSVEPGSALCDRTFADARLREQFGVDVVGAWFEGDFESPVDRDETIDDDTTLLVVGPPDRLAELRERTTSTTREFAPQRVVVAGFGESGSAAHAALAGTNTELTVLDVEAKDGVDVVGDAREPDVLREAGIGDASSLILTLGDDTTAVFATLVARDLNPDLEIVVRANEEDDVEKLYRAGADYVQSLATVSGRMLASTVFEDEEVLAFETQIDVVSLPVGRLAGRTLAEADVRSATGATVVAVERDDETLTDLDPESFAFHADDRVVVVGTDESVHRFEERFGTGPPEPGRSTTARITRSRRE